ncbi:hypothetical protein Tco_0086318 [Tanacetum coccineum]
MILSGADNHPPMLDKDLYDSWKSQMELYMQNREHGRMILESVENGSLIWPTVEENGVTRTKKISGERVKFVTDVKLVKDLHTTNFDQLHAYLEQHELHANEVRLLCEGNQDPLAFVENQQMTPPHFNTYQSSYNNPHLGLELFKKYTPPTVITNLTSQSDSEANIIDNTKPVLIHSCLNLEDARRLMRFLALGWLLEKIHMTWAHMEKKQTRLRLYTKSLKKLCIQSVETTLRVSSDGVRTFEVTASEIW